MHIKGLALHNYKNYKSHVYELHPKVNLIVGLNGVGKTNALDAVFYSCIGRSYTSVQDRHNIRKEEDYFRLEADFVDAQEEKNRVVIKVSKDKQKVISHNGKNYKRISEHVGKYPCVMIAPTDVQQLLAASEDRRRFVDQSIVQYDKEYTRHLIGYNKLLKQRNALLKQMAEQGNFNEILLASISEKMYAPAAYIYQARTDFVEKLQPTFQSIYQHISEDKEKAEIKYKSKLSEHSLKELFEESLEKDRILQRTTTGIHKDDIKLYMNGDDLKHYASQGQLKSFVMAMKLSQYKIIQRTHNFAPILLLDDIFDKLDQERVKFIIDLLLADDYGQIIISDTNLYRVENILQILESNYHKFVIDNTDEITIEKN